MVHVSLSRTGNNQRGTGFVNEDGVHLVDDDVVVFPLHQVFDSLRHIVTQVVKAKLVVGAIGDVAVVLFATFLRIHLSHDDTGAQTQVTVHTTHQFSLVRSQVVVNGHDVYAFAAQSPQVARQRSYQSLAFTGFHFGNVAPMQGRPAHNLFPEVTQPEHPIGGFTHRCESFNHEVVKFLSLF